MAQLDSKKHLAMTQASAVKWALLVYFSMGGATDPRTAEKNEGKTEKNEGKTKKNEGKLILMMIV